MSGDDLHLRSYRPDDAPALLALFQGAIRLTAASHYDEDQRRAWAPDTIDVAGWDARLRRLQVLVAEIGAAPAGFVAWTDGGLLDLLFTAPGYGRRGVGSRLCREAESRMRAAGLEETTTFASHLSRPVFARQGWELVHAETVRRGEVGLERFFMRKRLAPAPG